MKNGEKVLIFNRVKDLYKHLHLPVNNIDGLSELDLHNIKDIHAEGTYSSPVFRANYFSFVFVKNGSGKYTRRQGF